MNLSKALTLLLALGVNPAESAGDALVFPDEISSADGLLDFTLTLEYGTPPKVNGYKLKNTRLLNGQMPGPTIRVKAGDEMRILFKNKLQQQDTRVTTENKFSYPDSSNLHFHGSHVSGELPSDDVTYKVDPGDEYQYETHYPENHMPGTHWLHPHVHGSGALQVGGGAALALIVEDPPGYLPEEVENAEDVLLFVQDMDLKTLASTAESSGDEKLVITPDPSVAASFRIVNGQHEPELSMQPGEWQRWRVVMGGWLKNPLGLYFDGDACEMQLLAKDGIYIEDYPRLITNAPIPTGGRADIMVRCPAGVHTVKDYAGNTLMTVNVAVSAAPLTEWSPERPDYVEDLQESTVDDAECSCITYFSALVPDCEDPDATHCINRLTFDKDRFLHTSVYGSLVERELQGTSAHPYHQHVYPFQMVEIVENSDVSKALTDDQKAYFQVGDWHDVVMIPNVDTVTMRYLPNVHLGRIMLHCHRLDHEDKGMMAQEEVVHSSVGSCQCEANTERATCEDDEDWKGRSSGEERYLKKDKKAKKNSKKFGCDKIDEDFSRCDAESTDKDDDRTGLEACPQSCGICALDEIEI